MNVEGKKLLNHSFVGSSLNYCTIILYEGDNFDLDKLQEGQNSAMRYILGWGRRARIIDMLNKISWNGYVLSCSLSIGNLFSFSN